ncbi:hypothetical protein [Kitasatospora sp. NPDC091207]|uniref:hypothetical protein n=1 Tax=Kitasatospora sp. NPDC091207 TaxID=3364083 RepID=UPI00380B418E
MDFPRRSALLGLSKAEYAALAAFDDTVGDLAHEWRTAKAVSDRLITMCEAAERRIDNGTATLSLHHEALDEATSAAMAHASRLERLAWRYTAAYAATGLSILDRLVAGRPPLSTAELETLFVEPTVGRLRELLAVPAEHRYTARLDAGRPGAIERYREERTTLLRSIESLYDNLTARRGERPWTRALVSAGHLSEMDDGEYDEPWDGLVDPLLQLARQTPFEISAFLGRRPETDVPGPGRQVTSLRRIHICPNRATTVTAGFAPDPTAASGERMEMTVGVCSDHDPAPQAWFAGLTPRPDPAARPISDTCGVAVDYRAPSRVLRAHADLWITALTGQDPDDHHDWPEFLQAAADHVQAASGGAGEDGWDSVVTLLGQAAKFAAEGNLATALASLGIAETAAADALQTDSRQAGPERA